MGLDRRGGEADRRPAGAKPRHDRRLAGARRRGGRPAGDAARARRLGRRARPGRRARDRRRGPVRGLPDDGDRARRGPHARSASRRWPATATAMRSSTAAPRTGRWSASARSSKATDGVCEDVRIGLTHMASTPLRASAAEDALRGQPLRRRAHRGGGAAGGGGHEPARRPQRDAGLQAPPRARADAARADDGGSGG